MSAVQTAPAVVCPSWCGHTQEEHLEELRDAWAGGDVHHRSAPQAWAYLSQVLRADGATEQDDQPPCVMVLAEDISLSQLQEVIDDLQAVAAAAKA